MDEKVDGLGNFANIKNSETHTHTQSHYIITFIHFTENIIHLWNLCFFYGICFRLSDWLTEWLNFFSSWLSFFFLPQKSSHSPKEIQWKKFYSNQPTKQNNIHEQWWWWFFEILHDSQRICCCCCRFSLLLLSIIISIMFWEKK